MATVKQLYNARLQLFIERRSKVQAEVDRFLQSVKSINPERLAGIEPIEGDTAQEVLPALWREPYDSQQYEVELSRLQHYISQVKAVADELNAEALRILSDNQG